MNKKNIVLNQITSFGDQKYPSFELRIIFEYLTGRGDFDWCQEQMSELELVKSDFDLPFISSHQALGGLNRVINEFYRPGLGCEIAQFYRLQDLGVIGACVRNAETLGEAMEITQAYYDLIGSFTDIVNIVDEKTFTNRLIDVSRLNPQVLRFLFELTFTGMVTLSKELSGQKLSIQTIRFSALLSDEEKSFYQEFFDCEVEDECKFNEWVVGMETLLTPVINKSDSASEAEMNLKCLLEELNKEQGLVDDIDCILKGSPGDFPDPDMVSHALGMSSRTLRRKLKKMGTSFSALMDKVRCQLAIHLIQHKNLSNEDLAEELGYSDAANFYNAFKKWTGHNPNFYRL
jgi:AraC-like DNA-binding protein